MLTESDKKQALKSYLETIEGISNKSYQLRVWINGMGPEVDDFDESVCHFFDDGDPILKNYKSYGITQDQLQLLKNFRKVFEAFVDENYWPPDFIDSPKWTGITQEAKEVLKAFDYQPTVYVKLSKPEFDYLKSAPFVTDPLFLSDYTGEYVLVTDAEELGKIQSLCKQQLKLVQSNHQVGSTSEDEVLTSVIAALERKEQPSFELNQR